MELKDYVAALRRYWGTLLGLTLAGLGVAVTVVLATPQTYQATAQVFVASTGEGTSGSQFVNQRVTTYPDVARSRTVLGPVIDQLGLTESFDSLRARVGATNPPDTSQIDVTVTGSDAALAARVANAVADRFGTTVEQLEKPGSAPSPVDLTVTNPATVPSTPVSPVPGLLLPLGLAVGLALGAAAAVVRSRLDTTVRTAEDVSAVWEGGRIPVLTRPRGRARRSELVGRPSAVLARRLEGMAQDRPVSVLLLAPTPDARQEPSAFAREVADQLRARQVSAAVVAPGTSGDDRGARIRLSVGTALAPFADWRRIADEVGAVVLVAEPGRVERAELDEVRAVLSAAGITPLAVVLAARRSRRSAARQVPSSAAHPAPARQEAVMARPVPAGR